jgi:hypothetical protein
MELLFASLVDLLWLYTVYYIFVYSCVNIYINIYIYMPNTNDLLYKFVLIMLFYICFNSAASFKQDLYTFVRVRDLISHQHKKTNKWKFNLWDLVLNFIPQNERRADKTFWTKWWEEIVGSNFLSLPPWILFWFLAAGTWTVSRCK